MRQNLWLLLAVSLTLPLSAEETVIPAARTGANLVPGPATVTADNVNVRGLPSFSGEVLAKLQHDEQVTVLEVIVPAKPKAGEPAQWAAIRLPTNAPAYVFAQFVDQTNHTVKAVRLNVRGGPGENYSVIGKLQRGDLIVEVVTKEEWIQIEPPTNGVAYIAAEYLQQAAPAAVTEPVPTPPPAPEPVVANAASAEPVAAAPAPETNTPTTAATEATPSAVATTTWTNSPVPVPSAEPVPVIPTPTPAEAAAPRIVTREGIVRPAVSIQAPSEWQLVDIYHHRVIAYLHPTTQDAKTLTKLWEKHVMVTGEESVDRRWPKTPVLTVHSIEAVTE